MFKVGDAVFYGEQTWEILDVDVSPTTGEIGFVLGPFGWTPDNHIDEVPTVIAYDILNIRRHLAAVA